jgi:glutamate synthase domain-containing protein 3
MRIDAKGLHYKILNEQIREAIAAGEKEIILDNVNGQRYIGAGLKSDVNIKIFGVPGNDLAIFMDGPTITVHGNGQDGIGNTMNSGKVVIHGDAGDITGYSMRGGRIFIEGSVGYRTGIHMKSYKESCPVIIVGGCAQNFLGEYMAGGLIVVLGLENEGSEVIGGYVGTGMHGGAMYIRGRVDEHQLGKEVKIVGLEGGDIKILEEHLKEYCCIFNLHLDDLLNGEFLKLIPYTHRPYGKIYAY